MFPRRYRRLFLLVLILINAYLLFLVYFGHDSNKKSYRQFDYMDDNAVQEGRKMKIFGAHPRPENPRYQNEIIIEDVNNDLWKNREDLKQMKNEIYDQQEEDEDYSQKEKENEEKKEKEEKEEEDYYMDKNSDADTNYNFQLIHRNKKTSHDLFPQKEEKISETLFNVKNQSVGLDSSLVYHCVSRDVIGKVPGGLKVVNFSLVDLRSPENSEGRKASFHKVFSERSWGAGWDKAYDRLDASGRGAQLSWAQEFISTLHLLINDIKKLTNQSRVSILDAPCGDMAWMSRFLVTRNDIDYLGVDIVPELIGNHRKAYRSYPWNFQMVDFIDEPLNKSYDIIISRMLLQHLYYGDVFKILNRFSESGSRFLVTTSFMRVDQNIELSLEENPGRVRKLNLELPPVSLTPPLCVTRDGPPDTFEGWDHFAGVWPLPLHRIPGCRKPYKMKLHPTDHTIYSCVKWADT